MAVDLSAIRQAREMLQDIIRPTPLLADTLLSNELGGSIYLKAECLQRSGSFKVRGAYNKISRLSDDEKSRGVVTGSAGNHAQAVALAARLHNIKSTIVLPERAPLTKVKNTKAQGAEVILHGASFDEAVAYSRQIGEERGLTYVHAFDDELVIAGQGTIGLEIVDDLPSVTTVVVPIGGGGIISGIAIAIKSLVPRARVIGVQAANVAPVNRSLEAGHPIEVGTQFTIADGIAVKRPGEITLPLIREFVDEVVEVTEDEIAKGIYHCVQNNRIVVEGAGAASAAALMAGKIDIDSSENICAVLAGGNIDANLLALILQQGLVQQGRYIILTLLVPDRPGGLAEMLGHVARAGGNVIEVSHRRAMWLAPLGRVGIELLLEVRDEQHGREVMNYLESVGYNVQREGQGGWED
jgi:threonine dehydratase